MITRVVLIPFVSGNSDELSPSERDKADSNLLRAMNKANQGAGFMIALGKVLIIAWVCTLILSLFKLTTV